MTRALSRPACASVVSVVSTSRGSGRSKPPFHFSYKMTITPFKTDKDLTVFARTFFRERVASFRKDVAICLTADSNRHHAYFPGLITCIGFVDLLSGLHAGRLEGHGLQELKLYASRFLNATNYSSLNLEVLYLAFRHKLAHLSFPYAVFDIPAAWLRSIVRGADAGGVSLTWLLNGVGSLTPFRLRAV